MRVSRNNLKNRHSLRVQFHLYHLILIHRIVIDTDILTALKVNSKLCCTIPYILNRQQIPILLLQPSHHKLLLFLHNLLGLVSA